MIKATFYYSHDLSEKAQECVKEFRVKVKEALKTLSFSEYSIDCNLYSIGPVADEADNLVSSARSKLNGMARKSGLKTVDKPDTHYTLGGGWYTSNNEWVPVSVRYWIDFTQ